MLRRVTRLRRPPRPRARGLRRRPPALRRRLRGRPPAPARRRADDLDEPRRRRLPALPRPRARAPRVTDLDGHTYVDFALGDTGAMAGHSPPATVEAIARQSASGITAMMPTEDAAWVGAELARRFGPSAVVVHAHGDRRQPLGDPARPPGHRAPQGPRQRLVLPRQRRRGVRAPRRPTARPSRGRATSARRSTLAQTTRVAEFNDVEQLAAELAHERRRRRADGAGADQHRHRAARARLPGRASAALTREHGTLLINDETHTFSAGPGGATRAWGLEPDIVTIGKAIAGGVPSGAFGISAELAERITGDRGRRPRRHRRRRRHAGRQRALAGRHPRHARARPHRRGVRAT